MIWLRMVLSERGSIVLYEISYVIPSIAIENCILMLQKCLNSDIFIQVDVLKE